MVVPLFACVTGVQFELVIDKLPAQYTWHIIHYVKLMIIGLRLNLNIQHVHTVHVENPRMK